MMKRLISAICAAFLFPSHATADLLAMCSIPDHRYGFSLFRVDEATGDAILIGQQRNADMGWHSEGRLTVSSEGNIFIYEGTAHEGYLTKVSIDAGGLSLVRGARIQLPAPEYPRYPLDVNGIAFSNDGQLYLVVSTARRDHWASYVSELYSVDPNTGQTRLVGELMISEDVSPSMIATLEFSPAGKLYGWDTTNYWRGLVAIDTATARVVNVPEVDYLTTGMLEQVGNAFTGIFGPLGGLAFSPSGTLYKSTRDIATVDLATGKLTFLDSDLRTDPLCAEGIDDIVYYVQRPPSLSVPFPREEIPRAAQNLFLLDCGPCPACYERQCDPRVNPDFDHFIIADPASGIIEMFSYSGLGIVGSDDRFSAAAPVALDGEPIFVASAPEARGKGEQHGSVVFFDRDEKFLKRVDGHPGERLGRDMDVRKDEIVVVSSARLLRFTGTELKFEMKLSEELNGHKGVNVAFTDDIDGDDRAEIMIGAPFASVAGMPEAGRIELIGSKSGSVIDRHFGRVAFQNLGSELIGTNAHLGIDQK